MIDFPSILEKLIARKDLSAGEARAAMIEILSGAVPQTRIAAFLVALRSKGESARELAGFVRAMRESMSKVASDHAVIADTCGTGGDGKGTFNISTAAAFVAAGAEVPVAKHGNRSISSACGSADVLEALGVKVDMSKEVSEACLKDVGITFLFAPLYHPAMKNVGPVRKELGIRTVFNFLGPLANPAGARAQVIGVPRKEFVPLIAKTLNELNGRGNSTAIVVHEDGHDEIVLSGKSVVAEVHGGKIKTTSLSPKDFGLPKAKPGILKGGDARTNAAILKDLLANPQHPLADIVIANASLAIYCAEKTGRKKPPPDAKLRKESVERARVSLKSGAAAKKLALLVARSNAISR